jgi:hypothetical protein
MHHGRSFYRFLTVAVRILAMRCVRDARYGLPSPIRGEMRISWSGSGGCAPGY